MKGFNFIITQSNVGILTVCAHVYITYPLTVNTGDLSKMTEFLGSISDSGS